MLPLLRLLEDWTLVIPHQVKITRRIGESILIGAEIVVKVTAADAYRKKARLGIEAPPDVEIRREYREPDGGLLSSGSVPPNKAAGSLGHVRPLASVPDHRRMRRELVERTLQVGRIAFNFLELNFKALHLLMKLSFAPIRVEVVWGALLRGPSASDLACPRTV